MTEGEIDKLSKWAIVSLTIISIISIVAAVIVAWRGSPLDAVAPVVAGAVAGIVGIVLRDTKGGAP